MAEPETDPNEIFADPVEEPETDSPDPEESGQPDGTEEPVEETGEEEVEGETPELDLEGLPFKSAKDLVKAYKELQSHSTKRDQGFQEVLGLVKSLVESVKQGQPVGEVKKTQDPQAFVDAFTANPEAVLNKLISTAVQQAVEKHVNPLNQNISSLSAKTEMDKFLSDHPELEDTDITELLKVIDEYPELLGKPNRLERFYKLLLADHPEIKDKIGKQKENLERTANAAKKAASVGGKKATDPKKTSPKDEFDEVLELDAANRAKFSRS